MKPNFYMGMDARDEEQVLARLLGVGSGSPVATPEQLSAGLRWLAGTLRRELQERPMNGGQEWGRIADIMRIYGVKKSQACRWMMRLREVGKVRVQNPVIGQTGKGDTFYNLADIAAAFEENARIGKGGAE